MEQPPRVDDLIGVKLIAHFGGKKHVCRLECVDLNTGVLTLRTKNARFFISIDQTYLEIPLK